MHKTITLLLCLALSIEMAAQNGPYRLKPALDIPLGTGTTLSYGALYLWSKKIPALTTDQIAGLDRMKICAFDRGATRNWSPTAAHISDGLMIGGMLSPLILTADPAIRKDWKEVAVMGYETFLLTGCLTNLTKQSVRRTRPYVYNPDAPMSAKLKTDARYSFFSGHTSMTTAMCFYTAKVYHDYHPGSPARPWIWASAAVVPAVTGYLRYRAGKHFPTDILIGYLTGAAVGILVPEIHRRLR